ncbi:peptidylprolyl isomerase [Aeoliella sp. SH292]|uniref:peptidylprolyl isomerase n=1 Tax=Aeoliella sp. SH292 TaxID=3454464 RepID=UPI003F9CD9DA
MRRSFAYLLLLLTALPASFVRAQDAPADLPAAAGGNAAAAQAAYDTAEAEYKAVFKEIETLRGQYQSADAESRKTINAQLPALVDQAREKMAAWTTAALELYKAAPNENQQVSDLLVGMAKHFVVGEAPPKATGGEHFGGDQYEQAMPILTALIEGGHPERKLLAWAGYAAVCVGDFDAAEKYLKGAQTAGVFREQPEAETEAMFYFSAQQWLQNLDKMRAEWDAEQKIRAEEATADNLPRVKFSTSKGDIVIELFEDQAPIATANMISLVKKGFYDGVVFHRVLPHFMAQGGDPTGTGSGGPGHNIPCECYEPDARKHFRGTLSMAHAGRDTGGSQFFLCFVPTTQLNGRHTAFGRVVEGIEVLGKLQRIDPSAQGPFPKPDKIVKAEVIRDRGHAYDISKNKLPER